MNYNAHTPILSICIPTYNRAVCISEQLKRLKDLLISCNGDIELIVSDNCSTDNTFQIVQSFLNEGMNFTYIRNEQSIGMDGNFTQCFHRAKGKYIWLLGDDDYIKKDTVYKLLEELKGNIEYGLIHINTRKNNHKKHSFIQYTDSDKILSEIGIYITFISSNIVNRAYAFEINFEKYFGSYLIQVPLYLKSILSAKCNLLCSYPIFEGGVMSSSNGGYNVIEVFVKKMHDIYGDFVDEGLLTEKQYQKMTKMVCKFVTPFTIRYMILKQKTNFQVDNGWNYLFQYCTIWQYGYYVSLFIVKILINKIRHTFNLIGK